MQCIFSRRLFELEQQLRPLLEEKGLLEKGIADRQSEWYESRDPVKIGPIRDQSTQTDKSHVIWLDLDGEKLVWSQCSPGERGFLCFERMGEPWKPRWEFSPCIAAG